MAAAEDNWKKVKLLVLCDYLRKNSSEEDPRSRKEILDYLDQSGIVCDRRTLTKDIDVLCAYHYAIERKKIGNQDAFYYVGPDFSLGELKIMIDDVQGDSFLPDSQTTELVDKIAALGGPNKEQLLHESIVKFNTRKHSNLSVYRSVSVLTQTILNNVQASFLYFDLDGHGDKKYRHEGSRIIVHPISLVKNEDYYYLLTFDTNTKSIRPYRLDRMDMIQMSDKPVSKQAIKHREKVADFTTQAFRMYGGKAKKVTLRFDESVINYIFDKFGEQAEITHADDTHWQTTVTLQVSPTFWGWMFQFAGKIDIISPKSLVDEYRQKVNDVINSLNNKT